MATTALNIIKRALRLVRVLDRNQPLQAEDRNDALDSLNELVLWLQTNYNHLWTETQAIVLMEQGKQFYTMGANSDRVVNRDDLRSRSLSAAAITGATSITVAATNVLLGDKVGVLLDSGAFHWTTASLASAGVTITLTDALPSDAASSNTIYVYTDTIQRPLRIVNAQFAYRITDSEIPLDPFSRDEYFNQPDKTTQGSVSQYYYSPQLNSGVLYVWPTAQANVNVMRMTYIRPLVIALNNIDAPDFPDEWQETLAYLLAVRLMDEYGLEQDRQAMLKQKADELLSGNMAFDNDGDSIKVEVYRYY